MSIWFEEIKNRQALPISFSDFDQFNVSVLSLGFSLLDAVGYLISIFDFYLATLMVIVIQGNIMMILYATIIHTVISAEVIKVIL